MRVSFTIATRSDPVVWATVNSLLRDERDLFTAGDAEIVIVDSSPAGDKRATQLAAHCKSLRPVRCVRFIGPPSSCLYKEAAIRHARGDVIINLDSHVLFESGAVAAALAYFAAPAHARDLLMGPCLQNALTVLGTNQQLFADEPYTPPTDAVDESGVIVRGDKLGVWVRDPRGLDPSGEPFEIQQQGTGAFAVRRAAWPGFHPCMFGFGGNETYLMERFRLAGGRVVCHPAFRWVHDFVNQERHDYRLSRWEMFRNYLAGFEALAADGAPRAAQLTAAALALFARVDPQALRKAQAELPAARVAQFTLSPHVGPEPTPNPQPDRVKTAAATAARGPYQQWAPIWTTAGGSLGGAIPEPLFNLIATLSPQAIGEDGEDHPTRTLELGCGLSTIAFHRAGTQHTSIESDPRWIARTRQFVASGDRVQLVQSPLVDGFYDWQPAYGELFDFILIDGPYANGSPARLPAAQLAARCLAPRGVIIVDDAHRPHEATLARQLAEKLNLQFHLHRHGQRAFARLYVPDHQQLGEGPGTRLRIYLRSLQMPECQQCWTLAFRMNRWGDAGCRERLDRIVADMLPRAREWWQHARPWMKATTWFHGQQSVWQALAALGTAPAGERLDALLSDSIRTHVVAAIEGRLDPVVRHRPAPDA